METKLENIANSIIRLNGLVLPLHTKFENIANSIIRLNSLVLPLHTKFDQFREEVKNDIRMLRDNMNSLNHSISNLSTCLQEHKQQTGEQLVNLTMSLQEHKEQTQTEMTSIKISFNSTQVSIDNLTTCLQEHKQQTQTEIMNLQISINSHQAEHTRQLNNKLDAINSTLNSQIDQSVSDLTTCLQEHKQQTQTEMTSIKTSLSSTQVSIDNLATCLQEHKQQTPTEMTSIKTSLNSTQVSIDNLTTCLQEHKQQTQTEMNSIKTSLNSTQVSIDNFTTCLQEHKQQTQTEMTSIKTSLNSTQVSIDNLTTCLQEHKQQTQTEMTSIKTSLNSTQVATVQLHQNMQDNITQQLETIKDCIESPPVYTCGGTGGWRRVVYLDVTDPHTTCPSGWKMTGYAKRTCGKVSSGSRNCDSATFPVSGGQYSRICGRIAAYQWGEPDAFANRGRSIDEAYACGVSVTHGTPRNHIWTFAAGQAEGDRGAVFSCPCDSTATITIPRFVGNDYFCESGINEPWSFSRHYTLHSNDTLWDGKDCLSSSTCCSLHNPPYFVKQLPTPTTDGIEARICADEPIQKTNIAVELVELYVQ